MFLGYAIDLKNIGFGSSHSPKKGFSMSLYSSLLGIDLFWRQTGNDYHIKSFYLGDRIDTSPVKGVDFDGVKSSVKVLIFTTYLTTENSLIQQLMRRVLFREKAPVAGWQA